MTQTLRTASAFCSLLFIICVQAASFDTVPIGWQGAVYADFGSSYAQEYTLSRAPQLYLSLSSNETGLSADGKWFRQYNCSQPVCALDTTHTLTVSTIDTVSNSAYRGNPDIQIANATSWSLNTPAAFLNGTETSRFAYYPNIYGFIGLGAEGQAIHNFKNDHPLFSIYLSGYASGKLVFGFDSALVNKANKAVQVLPSDANWEMEVSSLTFGSMRTQTQSVKMVFDLTRGHLREYPIMLPSTYYNDIVSTLTQINGVAVSGDIFYPGYLFTGQLTDLPDLVIGISANSTLTLTPELYTTYVNGSYLILFEETDFNLLTNNTEYIVLGWDLMSKLYTVFERVNDTSTISVYRAAALKKDILVATTANTNPTKNPKPYWWIILLSGVLGLLCVVMLVLFVKRWYSKRKDPATLPYSSKEPESPIIQLKA